MRKSLMILCSIILATLAFSTVVYAQEVQSAAFLDYTDKIPTEIVIANDQNNIKLVRRIVCVDTVFIGDFDIGLSEGLPQDQLDLFDAIVEGLGSQQYLFFRGTADEQRWVGVYRDWESPRLNLSLAMTRAKWAQERAGRGKIMLPVVNHPRRGIVVYIATYGAPEIPEDVYIITKHIHHHYHDSVFVYRDSQIKFGLGLGYSGLFLFEETRHDYNVPTIQAILDFDGINQLVLAVGWRHKNESNVEDDVPGPRTETYLSLGYTWWPEFGRSYAYGDDFQWLGLSINGILAHENIQHTNEYVQRAAGIAIGPRIRFLDTSFKIEGGLDIGYFVRREFGHPDVEHSVGINPTLRVNYIF